MRILLGGYDANGAISKYVCEITMFSMDNAYAWMEQKDGKLLYIENLDPYHNRAEYDRIVMELYTKGVCDLSSYTARYYQ